MFISILHDAATLTLILFLIRQIQQWAQDGPFAPALAYIFH